MYLIFDTETTGLPKRWDAPIADSDNWPRCVQIAWQFHNIDGSCKSHEDYLIKPEDFDIPFDSENIHNAAAAAFSSVEVYDNQAPAWLNAGVVLQRLGYYARGAYFFEESLVKNRSSSVFTLATEISFEASGQTLGV